MIWIVSSWFLLAAGLTTCLLALFWDRPGRRGRSNLRCRKCWYDLKDSGELPITCSECGHVSKTHRSMARVRRHKKVVLLGLVLMLVSPVVGLTPAYQKGQLFARVPTWMLVEALPLFPTIQDDNQLFNKGNSPGVEILTRLAVGNVVSHAEFVDMIQREVDGNIFARPGSKEWQDTTARWMRGQWRRFKDKSGALLYPDGSPADDALRNAFSQLNDILPQWYPYTRERWPIGTDAQIRSGLGDRHWYWKNDDRLHQGVEWSIRGTDLSGSNLHGGFFAISNEFPVGEEVVVDLTYRLYQAEGWSITPETSGPIIREEKFTLNWTTVAGIEDIFEMVDNEIIREILMANVVVELPNGSINRAILNNSMLERSVLDRVAMGVRATLFDGDDPIVEYRLKWMTRRGRLSNISHGSEEYVPLDDVDERIYDAKENGTLRVRLVGDPELVLDIKDAKRAWNGRIDVLYSDALEAAEISEYVESDE